MKPERKVTDRHLLLKPRFDPSCILTFVHWRWHTGPWEARSIAIGRLQVFHSYAHQEAELVMKLAWDKIA